MLVSDLPAVSRLRRSNARVEFHVRQALRAPGARAVSVLCCAHPGPADTIASDLRNAHGGQSSGPLEIDRPWDAYTDDHLGTPVLILPDDIPAHPYAVAMEAAMLAPRAEVSLFPGKEPKERIPVAVFLLLHAPSLVAAGRETVDQHSHLRYLTAEARERDSSRGPAWRNAKSRY